MFRISSSFAAGCAALFISLASGRAQATVVVSETIDQMAQRAPIILRGSVVRNQVHWTEGRRQIETLTEVRVSEVLKGDAPALVLVRQPGGELDGLTARIAGAARF